MCPDIIKHPYFTKSVARAMNALVVTVVTEWWGCPPS